MCGVSSAGSRQNSVESIFEYDFVKSGEIHDQFCRHYVYVLTKECHTRNYTLNCLFLCFNDIFNIQSSVIIVNVIIIIITFSNISLIGIVSVKSEAFLLLWEQ